jgi:flagellum-specific ATP synthase
MIVTPPAPPRLATDADWHRLFGDLRSFARSGTPHALTGRLTRVAGLVLEASGLRLPVGSVCTIAPAGGNPVEAEVVGFADDRLFLMPLGDTMGLRPGAVVMPIEDSVPAPRLQQPRHPWRRAEDRSRWLPNGEALGRPAVDPAQGGAALAAEAGELFSTAALLPQLPGEQGQALKFADATHRWMAIEHLLQQRGA